MVWSGTQARKQAEKQMLKLADQEFVVETILQTVDSAQKQANQSGNNAHPRINERIKDGFCLFPYDRICHINFATNLRNQC